MSIIAATPPVVERRMETFWKQFKILPSNLVFSNYAEKLNTTGLRWAPKSFLGSLPRLYWAGTREVEDNYTAIPSPRGLKARLPGCIFNIDYPNLPEPSRFFLSDGIWCRIYFEEQWHQYPFMGPFGSEEMAFILMEPLPNSAERRLDYSQGSQSEVSRPGILVSVTTDEAEVKYVKTLRHGFINVMESLEQFVHDAVLQCASQLWTKEDDLTLNEYATEITTIWFEKYPDVANACKKWVVGSRYASAEIGFAALIIEIVKPALSHRCLGIFQRLSDEQQWCVD